MNAFLAFLVLSFMVAQYVQYLTKETEEEASNWFDACVRPGGRHGT
jgi:hypothetical protein